MLKIQYKRLPKNFIFFRRFTKFFYIYIEKSWLIYIYAYTYNAFKHFNGFNLQRFNTGRCRILRSLCIDSCEIVQIFRISEVPYDSCGFLGSLGSSSLANRGSLRYQRYPKSPEPKGFLKFLRSPGVSSFSKINDLSEYSYYERTVFLYLKSKYYLKYLIDIAMFILVNLL